MRRGWVNDLTHFFKLKKMYSFLLMPWKGYLIKFPNHRISTARRYLLATTRTWHRAVGFYLICGRHCLSSTRPKRHWRVRSMWNTYTFSFTNDGTDPLGLYLGLWSWVGSRECDFSVLDSQNDATAICKDTHTCMFTCFRNVLAWGGFDSWIIRTYKKTLASSSSYFFLINCDLTQNENEPGILKDLVIN